MKIGVFDSGLGGLSILKAVIRKLPEYDFIYLGDTKNLPYGDKTQAEIFNFTKKAVDYLFKNDCVLVLVMCNTASAKALRKIQQEWLPKHYPERRVLGPIIPTVENCKNAKRVGVLATKSTVDSKVYVSEFKKINSRIKVFQKAAPKLVPLLEAGEMHKAEQALDVYLQSLIAKDIDTLILSGSTHYSLLKSYAKRKYGDSLEIISQDEIIPVALVKYLSRHPEILKKISATSSRQFLVTTFSQAGQEYLLKEMKIKAELNEVVI